MIKLEVEDYCQDCIDFEPKVADKRELNEIIKVVQCTNRIKCMKMYERALKQVGGFLDASNN